MEKKLSVEELKIEVDDVDEFNEEASEILTAFCEDLEKKGMTKPVEEEDEYWAEEEGIKFLWNSQASKLIHAEIDRLYTIGKKYFGDTLDVDISSHMFREP